MSDSSQQTRRRGSTGLAVTGVAGVIAVAGLGIVLAATPRDDSLAVTGGHSAQADRPDQMVEGPPMGSTPGPYPSAAVPSETIPVTTPSPYGSATHRPEAGHINPELPKAAGAPNGVPRGPDRTAPEPAPAPATPRDPAPPRDHAPPRNPAPREDPAPPKDPARPDAAARAPRKDQIPASAPPDASGKASAATRLPAEAVPAPPREAAPRPPAPGPTKLPDPCATFDQSRRDYCYEVVASLTTGG